MKRLSRLLCIILCLFLLAGCGEKRKAHQAIADRLNEMSDEITNLMMASDEYYEQGAISDDLHDRITDLQTDLTEITDMFNVTDDYDKDEIFSENMMTLNDNIIKCRDELESAMGEIADTAVYAKNLLESAKAMESAVNSAAQKGTIDSKKVEEYKGYCSELEGMTDKSSDNIAIKSRLLTIRQELAVLASQVSADNSVIDKLSGDRDKDAELEKDNNAAANSNSKSENKENTDVTAIIEAYTMLQNEASRKVELGDLTSDEYTELLNLGVQVAEIKEAKENKESDSAIKAKINEVKPGLYKIASKIGSSTAEQFK